MQKQISNIGSSSSGEGELEELKGSATRPDAPKQPETLKGSVGTLARGLDILSLFASAGSDLSQKEISEALELPLATVHRLTAVLTERGFLDRDPQTRRLRLGLELSRLVPPLLAGLRLPDIARGHLLALAADTHETVNLAVLERNEIVYLVSGAGDRLLTSQATVGLRLPAHCTALGKCLLAHLPAGLARQELGPEPYAERTPHTHTTWAKLEPTLREIRRTGVSLSLEEYEIGLVSIAVPVTWTGRLGSAAINVSLPSSRVTDEVRVDLIARLRATADALDSAIGAAAAGGPLRVADAR